MILELLLIFIKLPIRVCCPRDKDLLNANISFRPFKKTIIYSCDVEFNVSERATPYAVIEVLCCECNIKNATVPFQYDDLMLGSNFCSEINFTRC